MQVQKIHFELAQQANLTLQLLHRDKRAPHIVHPPTHGKTGIVHHLNRLQPSTAIHRQLTKRRHRTDDTNSTHRLNHDTVFLHTQPIPFIRRTLPFFRKRNGAGLHHDPPLRIRPHVSPFRNPFPQDSTAEIIIHGNGTAKPETAPVQSPHDLRHRQQVRHTSQRTIKDTCQQYKSKQITLHNSIANLPQRYKKSKKTHNNQPKNKKKQ